MATVGGLGPLLLTLPASNGSFCEIQRTEFQTRFPNSKTEIAVTLSVYARKMLPDGTMVDLAPTEPYNELAGFESTRLSFYGSAYVRSMGLVLLPKLAHANIHVSGDELELLEREVRILLDKLDSAELREYWSFRLKNILEAIRLAKAVSDGVGIVSIE